MTREEVQIAQENFRVRKAANPVSGHINNAKLPAGAPMYFYCKYCGVPTETLPELYTKKPLTICDPCKELDKLGAIPVD